jgi:hypothetical protein
MARQPPSIVVRDPLDRPANLAKVEFEGPVSNYLLMLGIAQTCRFQDKSFLKFLMSGGLDVDAFKSGKRLRISKPTGTPPPSGVGADGRE